MVAKETDSDRETERERRWELTGFDWNLCLCIVESVRARACECSCFLRHVSSFLCLFRFSVQLATALESARSVSVM